MLCRKGKETCLICGNEDTYVIWKESNNFLTENEFFLCHECGFFCRKYGDGNIVEGISFDPKIIPFKHQITRIRRVLKKDRKILEGLFITDHFPYKPPKTMN